MFSISFTELLLLMLVVLIVFGPDRLPEIARSMGQFIGKLRGQTEGMRRDFYNAVYTPAEDIKKEIRSLRTEMTSLPAVPAAKPKEPAEEKEKTGESTEENSDPTQE